MVAMTLWPQTRSALLLLVVMGLAALAFGCATQSVRVDSDPRGATVIVADRMVATTPQMVSLNRANRNIVLRIEKDGFEPAEVPLHRGFDKWAIPKLIGMAAGITIPKLFMGRGPDVSSSTFWYVFAFNCAWGLPAFYLTGYMYKLSPSDINVELKRTKDSP